jgi:hypothetical protein
LEVDPQFHETGDHLDLASLLSITRQQTTCSREAALKAAYLLMGWNLFVSAVIMITGDRTFLLAGEDGAIDHIVHHAL